MQTYDDHGGVIKIQRTPSIRGNPEKVGLAMSAFKEEAIRLIQALPEDCSIEDIQYHLYVRQKVETVWLLWSPGASFLRSMRSGGLKNGSSPLVRTRSRGPQSHREL